MEYLIFLIFSVLKLVQIDWQNKQFFICFRKQKQIESFRNVSFWHWNYVFVEFDSVNNVFFIDINYKLEVFEPLEGYIRPCAIKTLYFFNRYDFDYFIFFFVVHYFSKSREWTDLVKEKLLIKVRQDSHVFSKKFALAIFHVMNHVKNCKWIWLDLSSNLNFESIVARTSDL
mgnify:CR=1 FL=1